VQKESAVFARADLKEKGLARLDHNQSAELFF
jgi:hypothetical protein